MRIPPNQARCSRYWVSSRPSVATASGATAAVDEGRRHSSVPCMRAACLLRRTRTEPRYLTRSHLRISILLLQLRRRDGPHLAAERAHAHGRHGLCGAAARGGAEGQGRDARRGVAGLERECSWAAHVPSPQVQTAGGRVLQRRPVGSVASWHGTVKQQLSRKWWGPSRDTI